MSGDLSINWFLDRFVSLIGDLEKVPRDIFYSIRIRYKIYMLRHEFSRYIKGLKEITVVDISNFFALMNTAVSMKILKDLDINSDTLAVSIALYNLDVLKLGGAINLRLLEQEKPILMFKLKTKKNINESLLLDLSIETFEKDRYDYGIHTTNSSIRHLNDIETLIQRNSNKGIDTMNQSFGIMQNVFEVYFSRLFDNVKRRYLK